MMSQSTNANTAPLGRAELRKIVKQHLPAWAKACAADAGTIVMHEEAFGTSIGELVLLACAVKYAAQAGKSVHVAAGNTSKASQPTNQPNTVEAIYREGHPRTQPRGKSHRAPPL
jgi:hypothetical protein